MIRPASLGLLALASAFVTPAALAQELKIGFVRADRISESAPAKAAIAKLEKEFSPRDKELQDMAARLKVMSDKLDKDMPVLSESERVRRQRELADLDKEIQRKNREFREDLAQRRNEEIAAVSERANKVIKQIAEKEKYDLILQEAVHAGPRVDITDKVLSILNK
ncbi:OmpH family outer membrane protein [Massilia sp. W12]|uniref:OmpH family outer membrane protein n=1 Tax=Massilia sp. W12 TaxID=3126507 RepID=UPI0030CD83AE